MRTPSCATTEFRSTFFLPLKMDVVVVVVVVLITFVPFWYQNNTTFFPRN